MCYNIGAFIITIKFRAALYYTVRNPRKVLVIVQATISGGSGLRVISDEPNYGGVESLGFRVQDLGFIGFRVQG